MTKEELRTQTMEWKNNYILKLEKENAELKEESDFYHREKGEYKSSFLQEVRKTIKLNKQLTKAKEFLNEFMRISSASTEDFEHDYTELIREAEQFLNSEVEK